MDMIHEAYSLYDAGIGTNEIAKRLGKHRSTVQAWLKKRGFPLRKRGLANWYNIRFFDEYNEEAAYWAGFFLADGHVRKNNKGCDIHLAGKDRSHLDHFSRSINFQGTIEECKDGSVRLTVNGNWFPVKLKELYGIVPAKSDICCFPNQLPKSLWSHFLRGFFDGDGCITKPTGSGIPQINFTSTHAMLEWLRKMFQRDLGIELKTRNDVPPIQVRNEKYGQLCYSGCNAAVIMRWLYASSNVWTRLARKYQRWQEYFAEYESGLVTCRFVPSVERRVT